MSAMPSWQLNALPTQSVLFGWTNSWSSLDKKKYATIVIAAERHTRQITYYTIFKFMVMPKKRASIVNSNKSSNWIDFLENTRHSKWNSFESSQKHSIDVALIISSNTGTDKHTRNPNANWFDLNTPTHGRYNVLGWVAQAPTTRHSMCGRRIIGSIESVNLIN